MRHGLTTRSTVGFSKFVHVVAIVLSLVGCKEDPEVPLPRLLPSCRLWATPPPGDIAIIRRCPTSNSGPDCYLSVEERFALVNVARDNDLAGRAFVSATESLAKKFGGRLMSHLASIVGGQFMATSRFYQLDDHQLSSLVRSWEARDFGPLVERNVLNYRKAVDSGATCFEYDVNPLDGGELFRGLFESARARAAKKRDHAEKISDGARNQ